MARKQKVSSWSDEAGRTDDNGEHLAALENGGVGTAEVPAPKARAGAVIVLPKLELRTFEVTVEGDSPLVCHRWSEKARKEILDKQMGVASAGKEHKDPERDFWESLYHLAPGQTYPHKEGYHYGFPVIAFKNAAVTACTSLGKSVTKVAARQAFHVMGDLVEITGVPEMRDDMVRVGQGTADIRFRGAFPPGWRATITIRYNVRALSDAQVVNLLNTAGFAVGIGEWRPERDGQWGTFHVV